MSSCEVDTVKGKGMFHMFLENMTRDSLLKCGVTMNGPDKGNVRTSNLKTFGLNNSNRKLVSIRIPNLICLITTPKPSADLQVRNERMYYRLLKFAVGLDRLAVGETYMVSFCVRPLFRLRTFQVA